jgi:hypothetical protein
MLQNKKKIHKKYMKALFVLQWACQTVAILMHFSLTALLCWTCALYENTLCVAVGVPNSGDLDALLSDIPVLLDACGRDSHLRLARQGLQARVPPQEVLRYRMG